MCCSTCSATTTPRFIKGLCESCYYKARRQNPAIRARANANVRRSAAKKTPRERYDRWLQYTYGITIEDYDCILDEQGGVCAVCKTDQPGANKMFFSVDHNHMTGRVRGLLCNDCNFAAGRLQDNYIVAQALADYLRMNGGTVDQLIEDMIHAGMKVDLS